MWLAISTASYRCGSMALAPTSSTRRSRAWPEVPALGRVAFVGAALGVRPARDLRVGESVCKVGRTTGLTFGHVVAIAAPSESTTRRPGWAITSPCSPIRFSRRPWPGTEDSGALLLDGAQRAVGMLGGGSNTHTVFNACDVLEDLLHVRFVTDSHFQTRMGASVGNLRPPRRLQANQVK